jgi:3-isopropylmalate dehydrogenase
VSIFFNLHHTPPKVTEESPPLLPGWIRGPIGHSAYPRNDATRIMPSVRKRIELFASIKPVMTPGIGP